MTFSGLSTGTHQLGWQDCETYLQGFSYLGSQPTQPQNPTGTNWGRYFNSGTGLIVFTFKFVFDANTVFGSGEDFWGIRLPVPANRGSGAADLTNAVVWAWQGAAASPQLNMPVRATLMDPAFHGGNNGMEDYFIQVFQPHLLSMGTGSVTGANTDSGNIAHGLGSTPAPGDFTIVGTSNPTANIGEWFILSSNITSTNFKVSVHTAPSTNPWNFSWKCRMEPNGSTGFDVLLNHTRPWLWASGHQLSGTVVYEGQV